MTISSSKKIAIWLFTVIVIFCSVSYILLHDRKGDCGNSVCDDIARLKNFQTSTVYVEFFGDVDFLKFLGRKEEITARFLKILQQRADKRFTDEKIIFRQGGQGSSFVNNPLDLGIQLNIGAAASTRTVFTAQISRSKYFDYYQEFLSSHNGGDENLKLTREEARKFLDGRNSTIFLTKTVKFQTSDVRSNTDLPLQELSDWIVGNMQPYSDKSRKAEEYLKNIADPK